MGRARKHEEGIKCVIVKPDLWLVKQATFHFFLSYLGSDADLEKLHYVASVQGLVFAFNWKVDAMW